MAQNIEIKYRCADLRAVEAAALDFGAVDHGLLVQRDTYFRCASGRLKLREIEGASAELIGYHRPDAAEARASDYTVVKVADAAGILAALTATLGVVNVVAKRRRLLLWENVRIHLDEVEGLGTFAEFESVMSKGVEAAATLAELLAELRPALGDVLSQSYSDLK